MVLAPVPVYQRPLVSTTLLQLPTGLPPSHYRMFSLSLRGNGQLEGRERTGPQGEKQHDQLL